MRKYLLVFVYFLVWATLAQKTKNNQHTSKQDKYVKTNNHRITSSEEKISLTKIYGLEDKIGSIKLVPHNKTYKINFNSAEHKFVYNPESGMLDEKNLNKHLAFLCSIIRFLVLEGIDGKEIKIKVTPFKMKMIKIKEEKKRYFTTRISYDNKDDYSKEVNCDIYRVNVSSYFTYIKDFPKPLRDFLERNTIL